ncbi:MAG: response regulator/GGDEF domain protein [Myxococcales bacterium]|nr:response regulator/GGDEF domain protein [Myxococcales bacterium]
MRRMDNVSGGPLKKDQTHTKPAAPIESDKEQKRNLAYLVVLAGVSAGEMFKLQVDRTVIGRGPNCTVRLNDEGVSREHCQLVREDGPPSGDTPAKESSGNAVPTDKIVLEDLGSTNGTFCNGIRIDRRELADGDKIMVGSTTILKFTYHDYLDEVFQRQMYESALRDGLTKVFNKKYFTDYLEKEFSYAARHSSPLSLIFLDIDYFKRINDTHGHPAGDAVLSELSQLMATLVRTEDVLARFGGEEFTVLCRGTDMGGARIVAERLRKTVEAHRFSFGAKTIPVTISLGIAAIPDTAIVDHAQFLAASDKALYEAKRTGRNRVCLHGTEKTPSPTPRRATGSGPTRG